MSRKNCEGCIYYRHIADSNSRTPWVYHYILDTGKRRQSDPAHCDKKELRFESNEFSYISSGPADRGSSRRPPYGPSCRKG